MATISRTTVPASRRPLLAALALLATLAPALPGALAAQQGVVTYTWTRQFGFEVPGDWKANVPDSETGTMVFVFDPTASLMSPATDESSQSLAAGDRISDRRLEMLKRMKSRSTSRGDQEVMRDTWVGYGKGTVVETREFMGRTFRIEGERPAYKWRLTSEQAEHLGHMVVKATAEVDSAAVEAWFAPGIAVPGGPATYGGLPGLILVLSVDGGQTQYFAEEIALGELDGALIRVPEGGDQVTREEYEAIVSEKLDELERLNRRRGGGR